MSLYSNTLTNVKYSPSTRDDILKQYKKRASSTRFDYYHLAHSNVHKSKMLVTFTYLDDNKFFKMQVVNDIRNYFNKLIRNLRDDDTKFFSSIEMGKDFSNPHVHFQLWFNESSRSSIVKAYQKTIAKFGLFQERCVMTLEEKQTSVFHYVIKDYAKSLTDDEILDINMYRSMYRKELGKNLRFTSHSSGLNTKSLYKQGFSLGIVKNDVDSLIASCVINREFEIVDDKIILFVLVQVLMRVLGQIDNKMKVELRNYPHNDFLAVLLFEFWIFGFIDRYVTFYSPKNLIQRKDYVVNNTFYDYEV